MFKLIHNNCCQTSRLFYSFSAFIYAGPDHTLTFLSFEGSYYVHNQKLKRVFSSKFQDFQNSFPTFKEYGISSVHNISPFSIFQPCVDFCATIVSLRLAVTPGCKHFRGPGHKAKSQAVLSRGVGEGSNRNSSLPLPSY